MRFCPKEPVGHALPKREKGGERGWGGGQGPWTPLSSLVRALNSRCGLLSEMPGVEGPCDWTLWQIESFYSSLLCPSVCPPIKWGQ